MLGPKRLLSQQKGLLYFGEENLIRFCKINSDARAVNF